MPLALNWPKMAILNPEHLLEQADQFIGPPRAGPPRQVDLRRAISAAYYAIFHMVLTAAADEFVGASRRSTKEYGLVFRSVDHRTLKLVCQEVAKPSPTFRYAGYMPEYGFGPEFDAFVSILPELQESRHSADYDPLVRFRTSEAKSVVALAWAAMGGFKLAPAKSRKAFLVLLLFPPKR